MEYLEKALRINVRYDDWSDARKLPYLITDRYTFHLAWLDDYKVLFIYVNGEPDQLASLKKHLVQIHRITDLPLVLILNQIDARRRQQLINASIPFIVPDQQIYLPFLGAVLQERYTKKYSDKDALMPSSELLLLYYINNGCKPLYMNDATRDLGFSAMTISRASRQLEAKELIRTHKEGVNKVVTSELQGKSLFEKAQAMLTSPVRKTVYIDIDAKSDDLPLSGYSALSEYGLLNPPQVECYAASKIPEWANGIGADLLDSDEQICLEIWNYDPKVLSKDKKVCLLPLIISLKNDPDERVQQAIEDALEQYWEEYDG